MASYVSKHTGAQIDAAVSAVLSGNAGSGGSGGAVVDATLTVSGAAADAKATGDRLTALSEEIAGQTSPEAFGAVGDGVTDDASAITQALTSGQNVVFDGTKTYAVGSTITIPADSIVDFRGATIVPMGNHDVIRVKPGARIENLIVKCTDVSGWDSSALVFYGGDMFRGSSPTQLNNVKLYNDMTFGASATKGGNGLYLYADEEGQFVEGISAVDVSTCGFTHGVHMHGKLPDGERLPSIVFVGANNFRNYWSFKDDIGVYIDGRLPNNHLTNNFFTNLNIQSDYYGGTTCGIYCTGFCNYFSGCLYDFLTKAADPTMAVFFDTGSQQNVLEVTDGLIHTPGYTVDKGGNNRVIKQRVDNFHTPYRSNGLGMSGNQDDVLAFADKFADCVLESIDSEPRYGDLSSVFDPSPKKYLEYRAPVEDSSKARAAITINLKRAMGVMTHFILQFKKAAPKSVKVTLYTATDTVVICNEKENYNKLIVVTPELTLLDDVYGVVKIVVELGGFTNSFVGNDGKTYGSWALERIMAVDSYNTGNAWLRRDGGELGGDLKFQQNKGPVLMDANGKKYMLVVSTDGVLGVTDYVEREEDAPEAAKLIPVMAAGPAWYNADLAGAAQNTITSVAFNANYEPTGSEDASWPCDEDGNGNIMAYRSGTAVTIKPTTGSDKIQLNPESSHMFANDGTNASFSALASITGTEMWVANKDTIMNRVCVKNERITQPVCIPAGVTYMNSAFAECYKLTTPPELPEGLMSLSNAFSQCIALQYLPELPSTVTNIEYAFLSCRVATKAPSVVPEKTMKMAAAFRNCQNIDGTIEVNAKNVTTYDLCFLDTCKTSGSITLTGTSPHLEQLAATNTEGKVTVAS